MAFEDIIFTLEAWGVADVLLPFLLIFTIVFAILQKAKILGDDKKNMNIIIALIIGLSVVIPHITGTYPPGADVVDIMNQALPNISIVLVAVIALLLLMGIFGFEMSKSISGGVVAFAIIVVLYVFGAAAGWWGDWNWITNYFGEDAITIIVIILVFAVLIWYITKDDKSETAGKGLFKSLEDMFKK